MFRDSYEWVHVICAWWIPEVKIEDVKFIERIRKDKIPVGVAVLTTCYSLSKISISSMISSFCVT